MEIPMKKAPLSGVAVLAVVMLSACLGACASPGGENRSAGDSVVPTNVKVERRETSKNISPLPLVTAVTMRQFYSDGHHEDRKAYVEYDFNRDGRVDMLEVLDAQGKPVTYVYDFDFDGIIDAHERVRSAQKNSQRPK